VWRTHVGETKTPESKNAVPVIGPLRKLLDQHRIKSNANGDGTKWIFAGEKKGFALHLDNLCRRDMKPVLGDRWLGWHAFRRGLGTNLFGLGVPAEVAQTTLRHANVSTTRTHYIVLESQQAGSAAMQKLETAVLKVGQIRASRKAKKRRKPHKH
jgi:integrase